jgi:thiosulfate reductase cytochrome b subunit
MSATNWLVFELFEMFTGHRLSRNLRPVMTASSRSDRPARSGFATPLPSF